MIRKGDFYYVYNYRDTKRKSGRPAVVLSGEDLNRESDAVIVAYLSTKPSDLYSADSVPVLFSNRWSYAITHKPAAITKNRLSRCMGRASASEISGLESSLCRVLEL